MGVDYLYCGSCKDCYYSDYFDPCEFCDEYLEHPSTHGYFCTDCAIWYLVKEDEEETLRFCSENCYNDWCHINK